MATGGSSVVESGTRETVDVVPASDTCSGPFRCPEISLHMCNSKVFAQTFEAGEVYAAHVGCVIVYDIIRREEKRGYSIPSLKTPFDIAVNPTTKFIYVSDLDSKVIHQIDALGGIHPNINFGGAIPAGLCISRRNTLLAINANKECVVEIGTEGVIRQIPLALPTGPTNNKPLAIAEHLDGSYVVTYSRKDQDKDQLYLGICIYDSDWKLDKVYGTEETQDTLCFPQFVTVDRSTGAIYISDEIQNKILVFGGDLSYLGNLDVSYGMYSPCSLCFDQDMRRLYVATLTSIMMIQISPASPHVVNVSSCCTIL